MEVTEEAEVAAEQGEAAQEGAAAEEAEVGAAVAAEERPGGRQRLLGILVGRPGWSARAGTAAQAFLVASLSRLFRLLSSQRSSSLRCSHVCGFLGSVALRTCLVVWGNKGSFFYLCFHLRLRLSYRVSPGVSSSGNSSGPTWTSTLLSTTCWVGMMKMETMEMTRPASLTSPEVCPKNGSRITPD